MAQERPAEVILKRVTEPSGPPIAAVEAGNGYRKPMLAWPTCLFFPGRGS